MPFPAKEICYLNKRNYAGCVRKIDVYVWSEKY
jgi:hypothetical protein